MSFVSSIKKRINDFYYSENVSLEEKSFYLVMTCSIPVLLILGCILCTKSTSDVMSHFCFMIVAYVICSTLFATITNAQTFFAILYCILMNFFFTPIMFFMSNGIYFGMVLFFVLGIIVTIFLLGNKVYTYVLAVLEFICDLFLIIYVYLHKDRVYTTFTVMSQEQAMAISFFAVASAVIFIFIYQNLIQREMQRTIIRDNESIERAENTKGRFLANMTHEIRTPMSTIIGITDLILRDELSKNTKENVNTIKQASGQLLQIINNILEYSKLDSGRAHLIENEYSFKKMINEIVENISYEYSYDDISFHVFISKDIPDRLFGDDVRIKQVLRYLFFSSLSKTPSGTVYMDVNGNYDADESIITFDIRIASGGSGFSKDEVDVIFNAYSSYDSRQRSDYNKTGLELSICRKILHMMNGDLSVDSIEGIGTAVNISFTNYVIDEAPIVSIDDELSVRPLIYVTDIREEYAWKKLTEELSILCNYTKSPLGFRRALETSQYDAIYIPDNMYPVLKEYVDIFGVEDKVFVITDLNHSIGDFDKCKILRHPIQLFNLLESLTGEYDPQKYVGVIETNEVSYPNARVLCVDDSRVNLVVIENLLLEYDIHPTLCTSGEEALEILEANEFDILFIDQKMPGMDGFELLSEIKRLHNGNKTATAICATADFGDVVKAKLEEYGFNNYLAKPVNAIYLAKMLAEYLPDELRVRRKLKRRDDAEDKKTLNAAESVRENVAPAIDPEEFNPEIGIANLGGNTEAYFSVLLAYYEEGRQKLIDVPIQLDSGDIVLYTTNVHALKSSSATVGAMGISPMFKELEFAGKANNLDYINANTEKTFELFAKVLDKVEEYLRTENVLNDEESDSFDEDAEVVAINKELLEELSSCIMTMNLRRGEEIMEELSAQNFGSEINAKIKKIRNSFDNFEYMEAKAVLGELL